MIQHCRKTLHSRTKENRLVIQIQKALWRKLEPFFSRNKKALRFKRGQKNALASEGKSCRPENNNYSQSICMSRPLSVKHAAKITFGQYKCRTFQRIIYPADKNNFTGISSILAWGKSRVGLRPPFIAIHRKSIMLMHRPQTPQPGFGSIYTLLQKFTPHFKILDPRLDLSIIN